jgi:hypothetical protein
MSFRVTKIPGLRFDEDGLDGYSAGEDLDFSIRASSFGDLYQAPKAYVMHEGSPINRASENEHTRRAIISRHYLVRKHPETFWVSAFWVGIATEWALSLRPGKKDRREAIISAAKIIRRSATGETRPSRLLAHHGQSSPREDLRAN